MLEASEVPVLLRRSHVLSGYRPLNKPLLFYLKSAFRLHNELINIWTHAIPLLVLYFSYARHELAEQHPRMAVCFLYVGIACLFLGSTLTHMMHSRSTLDHVFWLLVDFSGIAIFSLSVGVQRFACRAHNSPVFTWFYLTSLVVVLLTQYLSTCSLFVLKFSWKPRHAVRFLTCCLVAIWLYIPLYDRYFSAPKDAVDSALTLHTQAFMWLVMAGFFMGGNFPECVFPGIFDIFGYGHQLFHLCIMMVTWRASDAARLDCPFVPDMPADSVVASNVSSVHTARGLVHDPNFARMSLTLLMAATFCALCVSFFMLLAREIHRKRSVD